MFLHIQPQVKQKLSFCSKCFEKKKSLPVLRIYTGTSRLHNWHQILILTLSKQLHTKYSSAWPSSTLIWFFSFWFSYLFPLFLCSPSFFPFSFPYFSSLCSIVPWVPLLYIITVYLVPLAQSQYFISNPSRTNHWRFIPWALNWLSFWTIELLVEFWEIGHLPR